MKYVSVALWFTFIFHITTEIVGAPCQCTSTGLQTVDCVEYVSKKNPCTSHCDCEAGRSCIGGWCHGTASSTNCVCLLGVQTYCTEATGNICNPNVTNPNCQCTSGRVCSSDGYCIGQNDVNYCTTFDIEDILED